jgi:two-component system NtrC family sensor kinase
MTDGTKTGSILVIEDEPSVMSFIRAALERAGYSISGASSGVEALRMLQDGEFRGVISDMRTPGGVDGADVYNWLSANRPELARKLIFISGDIVNNETSTTLRMTAVPFVEKPFRVSQLISVVEQTIGKPGQ